MRYLNFNDLQNKLGGRSRSSIYRDLECGRLPRPIKFGARLYWAESGHRRRYHCIERLEGGTGMNTLLKETDPKITLQETADAYADVVAHLCSRHRVVVCKNAIQWILQYRKNGSAERPWRGVGHFRTRDALIRSCATLCGRIDPAAMANLLAPSATHGRIGMKRERKCPAVVLQHTSGAETEIHMQANFQSQIYATLGEIQTRHVRNRCGLSQARAHLVAALFFGEGTK